MMLSHQRLFKMLALLITISFLLVACERPSPLPGGQEDGNDANSGNIEEAGIVEVDPNVGGGNDGAELSEEVAEQPATEDTAVTNTEPEPETTEAEDAANEETAVAEEPDATETEESSETQAAEESEGSAEAEVTQSEETTQQPTTHTVVAGDNLFRIGLKNGISWVTLAYHNHLPNPHRLKIGQVLNIPGTGTPPVAPPPPVEPTPSPSTETTHIVKPGENLFRIGLAYRISWIQIAEANGLVNPNHISVGQAIKIPVSAPGPSPQFTHEVKPHETLLKISIQYGVTLSAIASENHITPPYIIYVGQTLRISGK